MSSSGEEAADDVSIVPSPRYSDPALATLSLATMGVGTKQVWVRAFV